MSEEYKAKTREMIKVMQAYVDGQEIEARRRGLEVWHRAENPTWQLGEFEYRIAQTPDSIDWSHVAPEWKWMARDSGDDVWLFQYKPHSMANSWSSSSFETRAVGFASYKRGTVDWKDSLVKRPE